MRQIPTIMVITRLLCLSGALFLIGNPPVTFAQAPSSPTTEQSPTPAVSHESPPQASPQSELTSQRDPNTLSTLNKKTSSPKKKKGFLEKISPILILLLVVSIILRRLPKPDFDGDDDSWRTTAFLKRRVMNWLPLGMTYAFLYMGRYNLKVSKFTFESMTGSGGEVLMSNESFGIIFAAGTVTYGCSFLLNGPLTDRFGGRFAILIGSFGACIANLIMGIATLSISTGGVGSEFLISNFVIVFSVLYSINMYFQSFGAVAIVKVNASWFHLRERGVFGAIFGILISLGIYLAFDVGYIILENLGIEWVFLMPACLLGVFWVIDSFMVRNTPGEAGLIDFDTADASSGDDGPQKSVTEVFKMMMTNPIIVTIALIEFCSGFIRQAPMQWYRTFAKQTDGTLHLYKDFIYDNWGMFLCIAGILGGLTAGIISDRVFQSRRGPVAAILYLGVFLGSIALLGVYNMPVLDVGGVNLSMAGVMAIFISMCVIGVHGMLSGTASMDFGGRKNVGVVVGIIDGFVYLGTAVMSITYAYVLPQEVLDSSGKLVGEATRPEAWQPWPVSMIIVGLIGFLLATRVWNATPRKGKAS